jgi:type II secretory ATPase GspE/PulE/Tfp pilus assembly ATPase PilB-like protein/ActR/RegA family two-component response regulator
VATRPSRPRAAISHTLRDGWALAALERAGLLSNDDAMTLRGEGPEWVAAAVVARGMAPPEAVGAALAKAAGVKLADIERLDATAAQFVPESVARECMALPVAATNRVLTVATCNPMDLDAEQSIGFVSSRRVEFQYALPEALRLRIDDVFRPERSIERLVGGLGEQATLQSAEDERAAIAGSAAVEAPAAQLVDATIADAVREGASDVHFEPTSQGLVVRYRIDGVMIEVMKVPRAAAGAVIRRVKVSSGLDVTDPLHPHDGRAAARVGDKTWDLRVSSIPVARLGEKVVIRLLDPASQNLKLDAMGLLPDERQALDALLRNREGMVLVTGPTGSGKTSTLYACLESIRTRGINVVTVEDPVEYRIEGVNQIEVSEKQGFTFAAALRSVLRQDPDIVLLGEIRDNETATTALQAALSGHFVLSTLHTNDSASTIMRLRDIGIESFKLASALRGVLAQRLLRRLCLSCSVAADVSVLPEAARPPAGWTGPVTVKVSKGCGKCRFTGYRGRFAIEEILTVDTEIAALIEQGAPAEQIVASARRNGMRTLWESGVRRVWLGDTGYDEVERVIGEPASPRMTVQVEAIPEPVPAQLILIADDDPTMRMVSGAALQAEGFAVAEAGDGIQALMEAQRLKPGLLLLDMNMPHLDGLGVLAALRRRLEGRALPVVVVTSLDDAETQRRCMELGAADYITKPFDPADLVRRVRAVLAREAAEVAATAVTPH